ncbi:hypothetical protein JWZ98_06795 [Methylomonas sp. EFPC1]|uniref:hypothetical protein n=1 Tax=Methylomonas sp. EFPC1 TaxID=2812647 RepID=UPI001967DC1B|nr:hypothetical protein [Methylomonas sp. EFPC1]QSB02639.1 hypothetical protein JWZ98_06795 [Methylomonas sp. EFPC1]
MIRIFLIFSLLGPFIGYWVFGFLMNSLTKFNSSFVGDIFTYLFQTIVIPELFGLYAGGIPACVAGFLYWLYLKKQTTANLPIYKRFFIGSLVGMFSMNIYLAAMESQQIFKFSPIVCAGIIAAAVCACLVTQNIYEIAFPARSSE